MELSIILVVTVFSKHKITYSSVGATLCGCPFFLFVIIDGQVQRPATRRLLRVQPIRHAGPVLIKFGIQAMSLIPFWIPAFAGMTAPGMPFKETGSVKVGLINLNKKNK